MRRNIRDAGKYSTSVLLGTVAFFSVSALAQVSQQPLSLTESVPPNMIFTLDDSGSMRWAFVPDIVGRENSGTANIRNTRRGKSAYANPMYYDPDVTYSPPVKSVSDDGTKTYYTPSATSVLDFSAVYENGFQPANGTADLSANYKVSWNYNTDALQTYTYNSSVTYGAPTGQIFNLAENPTVDFGAPFTGGSVTLTTSGSNVNVLVNSVSFNLRRGSGGVCTITPAGSYVSACTRQGTTNNYTYTVAPARYPTAAYYYKFNPELTGCSAANPNAKDDDNCYQRVMVGASEQQNFAVWYSFYRTRALATLSAATLAFSDLSPSTRLTWQDLGVCTALDSNDATTTCYNNTFSTYGNTHRNNFLSWLAQRRFNSGTPLRDAMSRAGNWLRDDEDAWKKFPNGTGNTPENVYACRPSYHVLMTDGMWNGSDGTPGTPFNHDNSSITLPDSKAYSPPNHPYSDATNNTLADLAMHYWATDLNTDIDNDLPPYVKFTDDPDNANVISDNEYWDPRNDPATWQHMTNFIMGLGLTNAMNNAAVPWSGNSFSGTGYNNLLNGTAWPAATSGSDNNVYDLWHAALNSRGEFFSVDNPDAMVQAFKDILNRVAERDGTAASPSTTSGVLDEADQVVSYSYQTSFESKYWSGDLIASVKERVIAADGTITVVTQDPLWYAQEQLEEQVAGAGWESRNVLVANAAGDALVPFDWIESSVGEHTTPGTLGYFLTIDPDKVESPCNSETCARQRLEFLKGDRSNEGTLFRKRQAVLGDMLASRPVAVRGARYLINYANNIEQDADRDGNEDAGYENYTDFVNAQKVRATDKPRIYVGANDGMLHAFDVETGNETFAFIPTAVFPNLYKLTGKTYSHHYYVDGSPVVADAYFTTDEDEPKKWRTVLVGTLRAGGKGLFALDITNPDDITLLWEFDNSDIVDYCNNAPTTDEDCTDPAMLGYSFPQPTVARLHNGNWAVVTGNGYDSDGNRAGLLLIDLATGKLIRSPIKVDGKVTVQEGVPAVAVPVPNGLSTPKLADMNVDGIADYAYAGDLQGNLWRFNLTPSEKSGTSTAFLRPFSSSTNTDYFKLSYGGKPLFLAKAPTGEHQPITAAPNIVRHPSRFGYLIIFGTGKYFEVTDKTGSEAQQSIYGIWDTNTTITTGAEEGPGNVAAGALTRARLQEQEYVDFNASSDIRTLTQNTVKWAVRQSQTSGPATWIDDDGHKYGWYFDLPDNTGEMMVENMAVFGQSLFLQTLVPNDDPCGVGATTWTYAINTQTGGRPRHHIFKDLRDPAQPTRPIVSKRQEGPGGVALAERPDGTKEVCTGESCEAVDPDPESVGRQSWRRVGAEQ